MKKLNEIEGERGREKKRAKKEDIKYQKEG